MCTLTIIPWSSLSSHQPATEGNGLRLLCNRDESRLRPAALPPQSRILGGRQACMPIDPVSDGTWIGASDAGLIAVLMNVYLRAPEAAVNNIGPASATPKPSRGRIIPQVLHAGSLTEARSLAAALDHAQFEPFRLLLVDRAQIVELVWAQGRCEWKPAEPIRRPLFFTSSGLGDDIVAKPRRRLFDELFADGENWPLRQNAFHHHVWPGNERASVWMTRPEAKTVSCTQVELDEARVRMTYRARVGDGDRELEAEARELPLAPMLGSR